MYSLITPDYKNNTEIEKKVNSIKVATNAKAYDLIANWNKVKPYLHDDEIINSLKYGFRYFFRDREDLNNYDWYNPRLCNFSTEPNAVELDEIPYEYIEKHLQEEYERYTDMELGDTFIDSWIINGSFFAYCPTRRCHNIAYFGYEIGKKLFPKLQWYIVSTDHHSTAIGFTSNGKAKVCMDVAWYWSCYKRESIDSILKTMIK